VNLQKAVRWTITLGMAILAGTSAAQETPVVNKAQQETPAVKAAPEATVTSNSRQDAPTILSRKDKVSYAFGVDLARDLKRQKEDLNVDLLIRALTDALADKNLIMTDEEVTATLKTVEAEQKHDFEHAKMMIAEKNRKAVEAFVAENVKKEGVVTLPSGLQYKILKQGDGKMPTADDHVVCHYRGTLVDGTEFDSSYKRNQPATLPVKGVMAGWTQALQMMPVGSKWQIFIPPQLAYGERVVSGIGPNAMLIFEVELLSIQDRPQTASAVR
jgi:FKBP-type peptidyl-prolyl cis-trans isomerase FklB